MQSTRHSSSGNPPARRGAVLLVVMICLLLLSVVGAGLLRMAVTEHRTTRQAQRQLQAEWLAEAGLNRAVAMHVNHPEWTGESWTPSAGILKEPAEVALSLSADATVLRAVVRLAPDATARVQVTRECRLPVSQEALP